MKTKIQFLLGCLLVLSSGRIFAATHYVDANSAAPAPPYTSWATAAATIQDAVDVSSAGDEVVVTNGLYASGGRTVPGLMTNRVAVDRAVFLHSVNGPQFTIIQGYRMPGSINGNGAIRCVYLTNGASLSGFTLTNGATGDYGFQPYPQSSGGGVWCETNAAVSNCVITGNSASDAGGGSAWGTLNNCVIVGNRANMGGGSYLGTLSNCTLSNNRADGNGGGVYGGNLTNCQIIGNSAPNGMGGGASESPEGSLYYFGRVTLNNCLIMSNYCYSFGGGVSEFSTSGEALLINCTIVGNAAGEGGGGIWSTNGEVNNCIIYYNTAPYGSNWSGSGVVGNPPYQSVCTTPLPYGSGNITNEPLFVDLASGNLRLQTNSPCINAGNSSYVSSSTDLDGNPRIRGGIVDIGAYEFQAGSSSTAPAIRIAASGQSISLAWPLWASNFTLLEAGAPDASTPWTNTPAATTVSNSQNNITIPASNVTKFYRLHLP